MRKFVVFALLALTACDASPEEINARSTEKCTPVLVAQAPDGANLWVVSALCSRLPNPRSVYFASSGTKTVRYNPSTKRVDDVIVPTAEGVEP